MKKNPTVFLMLASAVAVSWMAQAGDLEPQGPPAPTMVTLQQIFDKLGACCGGPSGVPKTGQMDCFDQIGSSIPCDGTGQDGEFQAGVSLDPRFTDNADGTVTDNLTRLIWLQDANCFGPQTWTDALDVSNALANGACSLTDGSAAGDWRLPNVKELASLFDYSNRSPGLPTGHPFSGLLSESEAYWSSTTVALGTGYAWLAFFNGGNVDNEPKSVGHFVWPVRNRQ